MAGFSYELGACACTRDKCSYECETYRRWNPPVPTNADRIRAMTDEELAEWLEERCYQYGWLEWLRQEVKEET